MVVKYYFRLSGRYVFNRTSVVILTSSRFLLYLENENIVFKLLGMLLRLIFAFSKDFYHITLWLFRWFFIFSRTLLFASLQNSFGSGISISSIVWDGGKPMNFLNDVLHFARNVSSLPGVCSHMAGARYV